MPACHILPCGREGHGTRAAAGPAYTPGGCPAATGVRSAGRGVHRERPAMATPIGLASVGAVQRLDGGRPIPNGLRVVAERDRGVRVAGDLGDQAHLDPLRL